jgi:septum formation inhibitor MinC
MRSLLTKCQGSAADRAQLTSPERSYLMRYLLEHDLDSDEVLAINRPRIIIEYEALEPKVKWEQMKRVVKDADHTRKFKLTYEQEEYLSCSELMRVNLCPHQSPLLGSTLSSHPLTHDQKKQAWRQRFIQTKRKCHAQLKSTWEMGYAIGKSSGRKVSTSWTTSPFIYSKVAQKGDNENPDKTSKPKDKRKGTEEKEKKERQPKKKKKTKKQQAAEEKAPKKQDKAPSQPAERVESSSDEDDFLE